MKKKLKFILPVVVLLIVGAAYKLVLAPKPAEAKHKIEGTLVALAPEFVVNLAGGRYGKLTVSLLMVEPPVADAAHAATGPVQPHQNDVVRAVITDALTGAEANDLINRRHRNHLLEKVLKNLHRTTDEHVKKVFFTDIAVQ
jgi:flagellar basal body-associated protein FliL